jgi:hypothetical protein
MGKIKRLELKRGLIFARAASFKIC